MTSGLVGKLRESESGYKRTYWAPLRYVCSTPSFGHSNADVGFRGWSGRSGSVVGTAGVSHFQTLSAFRPSRSSSTRPIEICPSGTLPPLVIRAFGAYCHFLKLAVVRALAQSSTMMPVRVPSTTQVEDSAQVPNADRSARMSAGRIEPATR